MTARALLRILCLALIIACTHASATPRYKVIRLEGDNVSLCDLNNSGMACGACVRLGYFQACAWVNGSPVFLDGPGQGGYAYAVNEQGDMVGCKDTNPMLWRGMSAAVLIPPPGVVAREARDINNHGQIVGYGTDGSSACGILWQNGVATVLPKVDQRGEYAALISDSGLIVGRLDRTDHWDAVAWADGQVTRLPALSEHGTYPRAIDGQDRVFGDATTDEMLGDGSTQPVSHACAWIGSQIQDIGVPAGNRCSSISAANNRGQQVGECWNTTQGERRACLWENGAITDLNILVPQDLGFALMNAWAINDCGEILASTEIPDPTGGIRTHAYLLVPTSLSPLPAPSFSPDGGKSTSVTKVTITCGMEYAQIHYTMDGREPTEQDPYVLSRASVLVNGALTLKAKAIRFGYDSSPTKSAQFRVPFTKGLAMVSIPTVPIVSDPKQTVGFSGSYWYAFVTGSNTYVGYSDHRSWFEPTTSAPGRGFWARFDGDTEVQAGVTPPQDKDATIRLLPGWNLIGHPFMSPVDWDGAAIKVKTSDGVTKLLKDAGATIARFLWGWKQDQTNPYTGSYYLISDKQIAPTGDATLNPWQAYWLRARSECDLIIPPPTAQ